MSGNTVPILWYENEAGEKWYPPADHDDPGAHPDGFCYMRFRNPLEVYDEIHTPEGGRMRRCSTYSGPLALALSRPSWREMLIATLRYGWPGPRMPLDAAILLAAESCERCMNALVHRVGLSNGYRKGSASWQRSRTECEYCRVTPAGDRE